MVAPVALIDLDAGNVRSVSNALTHLGVEHRRVHSTEDLEGATHVILPGVGAFAAFMERLVARGFDQALKAAVFERGAAFLGICVGLQVLADRGLEFGETPGLGWIPGRCVRLDAAAEAGLPVPHVGWNTVRSTRPDPLFEGLDADATFYFVHSYHLSPSNPDTVLATTDYGGAVTAAVGKGRVWGVQFHPEKSQHAGLRLLRNFARVAP
jgi:glutamine amidotransferase